MTALAPLPPMRPPRTDAAPRKADRSARGVPFGGRQTRGQPRHDHVWRTAPVVRRYLDGVRGAIPLAETQIDLLLRLVRSTVPRVRRFLDLGCGDGVLGCALLRDHPSARGVFLDFSESMLAAAQGRLGRDAHRHQFLLRDYSQPDWTRDRRAPGLFDVVVSGFSIHHQPDPGKRAVYRAVFNLLTPGGIFLNLEHVASATRWGERVFDDYFIDALWHHHRPRRRRASRQRIAREYYHRADKAANRLTPVETQCRWLRTIGFARVDCYFKTLELALFGGIRPRRRPGVR